jgi:hypothetical protein
MNDETESDMHLGNVLMMLAELHADDRCQAFNDALEFYNARHPEARVIPLAGYVTRLAYEGPIDRALATPAQSQ